MILRTANLALLSLFLVSAALQYNDPDPYIWAPIYLLAAGACWLFHVGRLHWVAALALAAAFFLGMGLLLPRLVPGESLWDTEVGLETMGLGLAAIWLSILAHSDHKEGPGKGGDVQRE